MGFNSAFKGLREICTQCTG